MEKITNNKNILDIVKHGHIEFDDEEPLQSQAFREGGGSHEEEQAMRVEISKLIAKGVIKETSYCSGDSISSIFLPLKKDGTFRLILNLKPLNQSVTYHHFKMENLMSAIRLMTPNC